jgi:hypothetical protein
MKEMTKCWLKYTISAIFKKKKILFLGLVAHRLGTAILESWGPLLYRHMDTVYNYYSSFYFMTFQKRKQLFFLNNNTQNYTTPLYYQNNNDIFCVCTNYVVIHFFYFNIPFPPSICFTYIPIKQRQFQLYITLYLLLLSTKRHKNFFKRGSTRFSSLSFTWLFCWLTENPTLRV